MAGIGLEERLQNLQLGSAPPQQPQDLHANENLRPNDGLVIDAFQQQLVLCRTWESLMRNRIVPVVQQVLLRRSRPAEASPAQLYDFTEYPGNDLKLQDVFGMLQNWTVLEPAIPTAVVDIFIAGENFRFEVTKSDYSKDEQTGRLFRIGHGNLVIRHGRRDRLAAVKYEDLFEAITDRRSMQYMAKFILEALSLTLPAHRRLPTCPDRPAEAGYYNFLETTRYFRRLREWMKIRELLCEIMIVTQVAEAARPRYQTLEDALGSQHEVDHEKLPFDTWMQAVQGMQIPKGEHQPMVHYFHLIGQIELRNADGNFRIQRNSQFTGRVPYADTVFRRILVKILNGEFAEGRTLQNIFDDYFLLYKRYEKDNRIGNTNFIYSGPNYGRFHILFDEWIGEDYQEYNAWLQPNIPIH